MKNLILTFASVMVLGNFASAAESVSCSLYTKDKDSQEIALIADKQEASDTMILAMGFSGSIGRSLTTKYQLGDISVELAESSGCSMSCWYNRHILVTTNGTSIYTSGDADSLNDGDAAFFPQLTIVKNGQKQTVSCIGVVKK